MKLSKIILENYDDDSLFTFGYDLQDIGNVENYLKANYEKGIDYELHIGRGDDLPNAVTLLNPDMEDDVELGNLLDAAKDTDESDYESYRREEDDYANNELEEGENFSALAAAMAKELEGKEVKQDDQANEVVGVLGILSYVLLSNTIANMLSSMAKKIAKKQGWQKTDDIATKIYDWTHKNEAAFMSPIKRVLSVVMIGPTKKYIDPVTKGLYAIFIFFLAGQYGGAALDAVKNSKWGATAFNTVKSLVKGKEVHTLIRGVLSDVGILG